MVLKYIIYVYNLQKRELLRAQVLQVCHLEELEFTVWWVGTGAGRFADCIVSFEQKKKKKKKAFLNIVYCFVVGEHKNKKMLQLNSYGASIAVLRRMCKKRIINSFFFKRSSVFTRHNKVEVF